LSVHSEGVGKGTTFTLDLPLVSPKKSKQRMEYE